MFVLLFRWVLFVVYVRSGKLSRNELFMCVLGVLCVSSTDVRTFENCVVSLDQGPRLHI